jgi:hypothetical protein
MATQRFDAISVTRSEAAFPGLSSPVEHEGVRSFFVTDPSRAHRYVVTQMSEERRVPLDPEWERYFAQNEDSVVFSCRLLRELEEDVPLSLRDPKPNEYRLGWFFYDTKHIASSAAH